MCSREKERKSNSVHAGSYRKDVSAEIDDYTYMEFFSSIPSFSVSLNVSLLSFPFFSFLFFSLSLDSSHTHPSIDVFDVFVDIAAAMTTCNDEQV
jgi:hypothetical protein